MTSEQRREMRYQRRKKLRQEKLIKKAMECGSYEKVFSYENLYTAGKKVYKRSNLESFYTKLYKEKSV